MLFSFFFFLVSIFLGCFFFFFSSRRRHTRWPRDWSSDVCSSDLGLAKESDALKPLNDFWATYEIAGVALVDMGMWHWMYDHPNATPAELNVALVQIARDVWNRYYAPVFHRRDMT